MNSCKYYDCGWCYAPDDVETSASSQSACLDPDYCPYLKSQMTKEETLECEIKEYTLEIEQKAKEIGNLKDILDRKEQELKQMKETDISTVLIEGDTATIMGVKYKRIEEPKSPVEEAYKKVYGAYPPTTPSVSNFEDTRWSVFQAGYNASKVSETPQEPEELKTLYQMFYDEKWSSVGCDDICKVVEEWMSQYADNVMTGEYKKGYEYCLLVLEENLK
jgi:hypothetical protein